MRAPSLRGVIDTNVLFEGLTRQISVPTLVVDAWRNGLFQACVSNALAYEYADVLSRKLHRDRWNRLQPVLEELLTTAQFVPTHFSWRPSTPDPGDEHVVDCAMNASAVLVTSNLRDFSWAQTQLRLHVLTPGQFLGILTEDLGNDQE